MSMRLALLAAASPLALFALPAQAQEVSTSAGAEVVIETYAEPVVQDIAEAGADWVEEEVQAGASYAHAGHASQDNGVSEWVDEPAGPDHHARHMRHMRHGGHHPQMMPGQPRQLAYSPEQRAEWLSQCRALHAEPQVPVYVERGHDGDEELIGGVLGAAAGGVIGHEVGRRGDRLAGTLIGAGLGGLAGAVVGALIDGFGDDEDERPVAAPQEPGFDYCEAYLINYERGYGVPQQAAYAPVMMVPVAQGQPGAHRHGARRIIEEEIEVEGDNAPTPAHHGAHRVIHRQPEGDKRTSIR